jgi:hypothetical protein
LTAAHIALPPVARAENARGKIGASGVVNAQAALSVLWTSRMASERAWVLPLALGKEEIARCQMVIVRHENAVVRVDGDQ